MNTEIETIIFNETPDEIETKMICETLDTGKDVVSMVSTTKAMEIMDYYDVDLNDNLEL